MNKYLGLILVAIAFSAIMTPVFAIRMIDFIRDRNGAASVETNIVQTSAIQAPDPNPSYDWTTPFMAYARIKAEGGTLVKLHGWTGTLTGATLKIKLFTYQGTTKLYGPSTLYMRGTLSNGDDFFASVYMPIQNVEVYEFSEDRIYFNANTAGMLIINYDTGERIRPALDTIRFDIDRSGGTVNGAGGVGVGSDNEFRVSGMIITESEYTEYG